MAEIGLDFHRTSSSQLEMNRELVRLSENRLPALRELHPTPFEPLELVIAQQRRESLVALEASEKIPRDEILALLAGIDLATAKKDQDAMSRYQNAIDRFIESRCGGSHCLFDASWNALIDDPDFHRLIGSLFDPMYAPPEYGNPVLHRKDPGTPNVQLPNEWYFTPAEYAQFLMVIRHGPGLLDSKQEKVGRVPPNHNHPKGAEKTSKLLSTVADTTHIMRNLLEANGIDIDNPQLLVSQSPNTKELAENVIQETRGVMRNIERINYASISDSQHFGITTGQPKELLTAAGFQSSVKHPLYRFTGGECFMDLFLQYARSLRDMSQEKEPKLNILCTHSSTMQVHAVLDDMMRRGVRSLESFKPPPCDTTGTRKIRVRH